MTTTPVASAEAVDALWTLLETAQNVAGDLRKDGLLDSLGNVLACMLPEDRDPVLQILEHDAGGRTEAGDQRQARFVLRPNPFAQIYSRPPTPSRAPDVCYLELRRAAVVGARLARSLAPMMEEGWEPTTIALWRRLDPAAREFVADTSRRILETLAPCRRRKARI
jgi:hypothetical protein